MKNDGYMTDVNEDTDDDEEEFETWYYDDPRTNLTRDTNGSKKEFETLKNDGSMTEVPRIQVMMRKKLRLCTVMIP